MTATTKLPAPGGQLAGSTACALCHRDALVVDASGTTMCARHATIFMTSLRSGPGSSSSTQAGTRR